MRTGLRRAKLLLIPMVALAVVMPLAVRGTSCGHDFDFHLRNWMEVLAQWRAGIVRPHWAESANYGAGEPRFVFYPPLSWVIGALLGAVMPWVAAPVVYVWLVLTAAGLSLYRMAREWMPLEAAITAAVVYCANPYALFVVYERTAYAELLAGVWMPLLVLLALRHKSGGWKLGLAVAAVWLTNAPAAVMGCYAVAGLTPLRMAQEVGWREGGRVLARAVGGVALGMGLAGWYIVPAAYERRWVQIAMVVVEGLRPQDSWLFGHTGEPLHDAVLRTASWIAVVLLAVGAGAAGIGWKRSSRAAWTGLGRPMAMVLAVIFLMLLPVSAWVWRHAPELQFLQFPWRWLLVASVAVAGLVGLAIRDVRRPWVATGIALVIAAVMIALYYRSFRQPCDDEDAVSGQIASFQLGAGIEGTDEYTPVGGDNSLLMPGLPVAWLAEEVDGSPDDRHGIEVERKTAEKMVLRVKARGDGYVVVRKMEYPAWRVKVNGDAVVSRPQRDDGLMAVPVSGDSTIEIQYGPVRDERWGLALSGLAGVILLGWVWGERKARSQVS